jgi:ABC-type branched-subunit amino acid transport system substrate-binding protein
MRGKRRWGVAVTLLAGVAAVAALAASMGGSATAATRGPIVIGWAYDAKGQMAPFDNPALATARIRVSELNAKGGINGRKLRLDTCDTQNNNPARAKSCARQLLGKGAHIIFTTCDVDFATPVVQEAINRGKLAISTCIGTDQMGPKRFGAGGVRDPEWLADGRHGHEHAAHLFQERRPSVLEALPAARGDDRRARELPDRC